MFDFLVWLAIGGLIGWGASRLTGQREGWLLNVAVGVLGAFITGYVLTPLLQIGGLSPNNFSLPALLVSALGVLIFLAALGVYRRGGPRLH